MTSPDLLMAAFAYERVRQLAHSALPHAPVRTERAALRDRTAQARESGAAARLTAQPTPDVRGACPVIR